MKYITWRRPQEVTRTYFVKRMHSKSYLIREDNTLWTDWVSVVTPSVWLKEEHWAQYEPWVLEYYLQVIRRWLGWSQDADNDLASRHALPEGPSHAPVLCGNVWCSSQAGPCVTAHSGSESGWWTYMQWNDLRIQQCVGLTDSLVIGLGCSNTANIKGMILILLEWCCCQMFELCHIMEWLICCLYIWLCLAFWG